MATDGERDALAGVLERLRKQTRGVLSKRATPSAGGRVDGAGGDWITGYAACYEEYAAMGIDYASTADKLRGMQDHERSVQYRSEEHTYELQSLMRNSYAVFCLKKKK